MKLKNGNLSILYSHDSISEFQAQMKSLFISHLYQLWNYILFNRMVGVLFQRSKSTEKHRTVLIGQAYATDIAASLLQELPKCPRLRYEKHGMQWCQWIWTYLWSDIYDAILCVYDTVYMNKNDGC